MKRRTLPKSNKKYVVIGLLAVLFLSLFFLSFQKKREGMANRRDKKNNEVEKKKRKNDNDSTENILRNKIEGFKEKLEKMRDEKKELEEKNESLKEETEKVKSKLKNEQDINRIKLNL